MAQQTTAEPAGAARRSARATGRAAARSGSRAKSVASQAGEQAQEVAATVQEKGQQLATVASEQAQRVKDTVIEQAPQVGSEVVEQGRNLVQEARTQVQGELEAQSRRVGDSLSRLGNEIRALAEGRPEAATTVQPYVSNAADAVYDVADRVYGVIDDVQTRGWTGVLDDLQSFARRRPGAFLIGAAVAGFGVGRAVRASSDDGASSGSA